MFHWAKIVAVVIGLLLSGCDKKDQDSVQYDHNDRVIDEREKAIANGTVEINVPGPFPVGKGSRNVERYLQQEREKEKMIAIQKACTTQR